MFELLLSYFNDFRIKIVYRELSIKRISIYCDKFDYPIFILIKNRIISEEFVIN